MEFAVLGTLEVRVGGQPVALGGPKQRALLALLLLHANETVSRDRLVDGLWDDSPPAAAQRSIDSYVSRLRALLGKDRVARTGAGYALRVEPGELDLDRFESLLADGLTLAAAGDPQQAAETFDEALRLWRGHALADLAGEPVGRGDAARLNERRLLAVEARGDVSLALGEGAALVPELARLVGEHPYRERLLGQLMVALYRAGRQAEALDAYRRAKLLLAEELGLSPGPQLQDLERRILEHDASLGVRAPARIQSRTPRRRRAVVIAGAALVCLAAVSSGLLLGADRGWTKQPSARTGEVVALSASSGARTAEILVSNAPTAIGAGAQSLWVADANAGTVSRVDPGRRAVVDQIAVGGSPGAVAVGGGFVWAASVPGAVVSRIDPKTETVTQTIGLGGARAAALAYGERGLWVADTTDDTLIDVAPSGETRNTLPLDLSPTALAVGRGAIWVADYDTRTVEEVDPVSGQTIGTVEVGNGPAAVAAGEGGIWVVNALDSTVSRIDPSTNRVVATIAVGSGPTALALTPGSVWVANRYSNTLSRIDPHRNIVAQTVRVAGRPTALAAIGGKVLVGISPVAQHHGGTLTLVHTRPLSIDPALQQDLPPPQADGLTRDGLVTYNQVSGPAGTQLVPDLALGVPTPTDGGTTYTFRLRPGIRYSDGRLLQASDFRRGIERDLELRSGASDLFVGIVGAEACLRLDTTTCDLRPGIVTNDRTRTIAIHLAAPDPDFLAKLTTLGAAAPVPPGTPVRPNPTRPIPGTGPYKVVAANRRRIVYVRNPYFHEWSHAAQPAGNPDRIVWRFGLSPAAEVRAVESGQADWMADSPGSLLAELVTRRASQLHTFPMTETDFFQLNTTRPPFDDVRVRQALNLAIDRRAVVRIYGGSSAATATCQVLPPGISGYRRYCPWAGPDVDRARRLVRRSGTAGEHVTVWGWTDDPAINRRVIAYTAGVLRRLGFRASVHLIPHASYDGLPGRVKRAVQLIPTGWLDTSAYNFIQPWLSCGGALDHGFYCNPTLDRLMRRARALQASNSRKAALLWSRIDHRLVSRAAVVPLVNERQIDFISTHVTNFQHHAYWDILADQLALRSKTSPG